MTTLPLHGNQLCDFVDFGVLDVYFGQGLKSVCSDPLCFLLFYAIHWVPCLQIVGASCLPRRVRNLPMALRDPNLRAPSDFDADSSLLKSLIVGQRLAVQFVVAETRRHRRGKSKSNLFSESLETQALPLAYSLSRWCRSSSAYFKTLCKSRQLCFSNWLKTRSASMTLC